MNVNTVSTFLATGAIIIAAGIVGVVALAAAARLNHRARRLFESLRAGLVGYGLPLAWLMAVIATLGSLYYSQIAHFIPCEYCWYQRIAMYPLAIILGIAYFSWDEGVRRYVYPLAAIGGAISAYHYLIQRIPDLAAGTCSTLTPCTAALVWKFDLVSIPFMALVSFAAIILILALDPGDTEESSAEEQP